MEDASAGLIVHSRMGQVNREASKSIDPTDNND
jgi:hypothetical protein